MANGPVYVAAYLGAFTSLGATDRGATARTTITYAGINQMAADYAYEMESVWGITEASTEELALLRELSSSCWEIRKATEDEPPEIAEFAATVYKLVQQGTTHIAAQGLTTAEIAQGSGGGNPVDILKIAEIVLAGQVDTALTTFTRGGRRKVDMTRYPATRASATGDLTRVVRFKADIENAAHSTDYYTEVRLYDYTNSVVITDTTQDNHLEVDRGVGTEVSVDLTVGSAAGNLRNDTVTTLQVEYRAVGTVAGTDRAVLSNARLEISYE